MLSVPLRSRSERKSNGTIRSYCQGVHKLRRYVASRGVVSWKGVTPANGGSSLSARSIADQAL